MRITHIELKNWRNFKHVDIDVAERLFVLGPNASGKSNFLDALRFLRDLTADGGGFQRAVADRGGLARVRNLAARNFNRGHITLVMDLTTDGETPQVLRYELTFTKEPAGHRRPLVVREIVQRDGEVVLERPNADDREDKERLTQTALEQVVANKEFRAIHDFFSSVRYLHLVPHLLRDPGRGGDRHEDPFGADFLSRVARTAERSRTRRLRVVNDALRLAVPQLENLELVRDEDGKPHLEARYKHWREVGARQDERDFSDGTLRLIGLLWSLQEQGKAAGPVLLEEPELSLHKEIVRHLPTLIARASKVAGRQAFVTTHAEDLLADEGLGLNEVAVLRPGPEGTVAQVVAEMGDVVNRVRSGLTLQEALAEELLPAGIEGLSTLSFS